MTDAAGVPPRDQRGDEDPAAGLLSTSTNLLAPVVDTNAVSDIFARAVDSDDPLAIDALLFPDDALDDTVLEAIDAVTGTPTTLCPAEDVSVAAGMAAFLRPEADVCTTRRACGRSRRRTRR